MDLTTSVSGTFSMRIRTVPETSLPTAPVPVAVGCAGPPLPAQALTTSASTASSAISGEPAFGCLRRGVICVVRIDLIAARFLSLHCPGSSCHRVGDRRHRGTEVAPAPIGVVVRRSPPPIRDDRRIEGDEAGGVGPVVECAHADGGDHCGAEGGPGMATD